MEFAKERKKHLTYLSKIRPRPIECQNVLTYSVQQFSDDKRLEYMSFIEDNKLQHSWAAILAWWRFRKHTDMDKTEIQAVKRTMEIKKREEYTLLSNCRKHNSRRSPPLAVDPSKETPPKPSPPTQKKKKTLLPPLTSLPRN